MSAISCASWTRPAVRRLSTRPANLALSDQARSASVHHQPAAMMITDAEPVPVTSPEPDQIGTAERLDVPVRGGRLLLERHSHHNAAAGQPDGLAHSTLAALRA